MSLNTLCRALGNPERVRLVACLVRKATVSELLSKCSLSQSALSQHLAILRKAGVVRASRSGRYMQYVTASREYDQLAQAIIRITKKS